MYLVQSVHGAVRTRCDPRIMLAVVHLLMRAAGGQLGRQRPRRASTCAVLRSAVFVVPACAAPCCAGSVTKQEICDAIYQQTGRNLADNEMVMPEIKTLGTFECSVKLVSSQHGAAWQHLRCSWHGSTLHIIVSCWRACWHGCLPACMSLKCCSSPVVDQPVSAAAVRCYSLTPASCLQHPEVTGVFNIVIQKEKQSQPKKK